MPVPRTNSRYSIPIPKTIRYFFTVLRNRARRAESFTECLIDAILHQRVRNDPQPKDHQHQINNRRRAA